MGWYPLKSVYNGYNRANTEIMKIWIDKRMKIYEVNNELFLMISFAPIYELYIYVIGNKQEYSIYKKLLSGFQPKIVGNYKKKSFHIFTNW